MVSRFTLRPALRKKGWKHFEHPIFVPCVEAINNQREKRVFHFFYKPLLLFSSPGIIPRKLCFAERMIQSAQTAGAKGEMLCGRFYWKRIYRERDLLCRCSEFQAQSGIIREQEDWWKLHLEPLLNTKIVLRTVLWTTALCGVNGSPTPLGTCNSGASGDIREPISLHQVVHS